MPIGITGTISSPSNMARWFPTAWITRCPSGRWAGWRIAWRSGRSCRRSSTTGKTPSPGSSPALLRRSDLYGGGDVLPIRQLVGFELGRERGHSVLGLVRLQRLQFETESAGRLLFGLGGAVEAQQAADIAARLVGGPDKVVNSIVVRGRDQVMLKVTVAEVQRSIIKQLGIDLSANLNYGTAVVKLNNANPFTANNAPLVPNNVLNT